MDFSDEDDESEKEESDDGLLHETDCDDEEAGESKRVPTEMETTDNQAPMECYDYYSPQECQQPEACPSSISSDDSDKNDDKKQECDIMKYESQRTEHPRIRANRYQQQANDFFVEFKHYRQKIREKRQKKIEMKRPIAEGHISSQVIAPRYTPPQEIKYEPNQTVFYMEDERGNEDEENERATQCFSSPVRCQFSPNERFARPKRDRRLYYLGMGLFFGLSVFLAGKRTLAH